MSNTFKCYQWQELPIITPSYGELVRRYQQKLHMVLLQSVLFLLLFLICIKYIKYKHVHMNNILKKAILMSVTHCSSFFTFFFHPLSFCNNLLTLPPLQQRKQQMQIMQCNADREVSLNRRVYNSFHYFLFDSEAYREEWRT